MIRVDNPFSVAGELEGVLKEFRSRYLLAFTPTGVRSDDGWHELKVRLKGRPGKVKARPGYFAQDHAADFADVAAVQSALQAHETAAALADEHVARFGAQPVASDVTNFAGKFNNGSVDIIGAPAAAFKPLELHKGLGTKGAIVNFPLVQLTLQVIIRRDKFPEGFGQKSREYVQSQYPRAMSLIKTAEADIDKKFWMQIPEADKAKHINMMRDSRVALTNDGRVTATVGGGSSPHDQHEDRRAQDRRAPRPRRSPQARRLRPKTGSP